MRNTPPTTNHLRPFSTMRWWRMALKELREILRDRRTIVTLIGMPLLIYPLLGVTFQKLLFSQATATQKIEYRIAFAGLQDSRIFQRVFAQGLLLRAKEQGTLGKQIKSPQGTIDDPIWQYMSPGEANTRVDVAQFVADRTADIGIRVVDGGEDGPWNIELTYRAGSQFSLDARRAIEDCLRTVNDVVIKDRLRQLDPPIEIPIETTAKSVASADTGTPFSMGTLIPLILILMTVTGAVYPAIDLTAGERERGTLEALISAPVPRHELLFAKYLAVLTVALLTALANLTSMVITAYSSGLETLLFGPDGISLGMLAKIFGLLFVFAGFFSAVILILTSFARSFKEAQAYLIPVMLVSLAPGILCLLPGIEMNGWMSVTPLVNIVILARDIFDGRGQSVWTVATLLSTVLYSAVALSIAAKIFGTDAVLYGSEGSWADLVRRQGPPRSAASLSQAMFYLALLFPSFLILSGLPGRMMGQWVEGRLATNAILTITLFAIGPLLLARQTKVDWVEGFRLRPSSVLTFIAAAMLGLSIWPFAYELELQAVSPARIEAMKGIFEQMKSLLDAIPYPVKLIALALIPAVCEELFFRGYLLTALRSGMASQLAIAMSAVLFGLFHVFVMDSLFFERFVPSTFLGLILGWVCYRTGSVLPGMLLHTIHNGLLLSLSSFTRELASFGIGTENQEHLPRMWLIGAGVTVMIGMTLLLLGTRTTAVVEDASVAESIPVPDLPIKSV